MVIKPHLIFFLCSEQNFKAAYFDWICCFVSETKEIKVSMDMIHHWVCKEPSKQLDVKGPGKICTWKNEKEK